jgi:microcin C transport system substrate-binding protein
MRITAVLAVAAFAVTAAGIATAQENIKPVHAMAMHGTPKYPPGFTHFDYANPDAPKGGEMRLNAIGTFDTLNPFALKGVPAAGLGNLFESLTESAQDEAFTRYGLLAESMEMPADRSWVAFNLRPGARWHDGKPVTPEDVIFSLNILKTKGHPFYRAYYKNIAKAEKIGPRKVKFSFSGGDNRELPLIAGEVSVLPKHYWEGRDFEKTTLDIPIGSGPYRIKSFEPGRSITYERDNNYWGEDLPVRRGQNNNDVTRYDYYRDSTVALEAFKSGEYDFVLESSSKNWATAYNVPAVKQGLIKKELLKHELPTGMQAFIFNTRRSIFADPLVRRALTHAFDFEWSNKTLFYGQYARTQSFFSNSELASSGLPSPAELVILEPLRGQIPAEVFTTEYHPPSTDGSGNIRNNLRAGLALLRKAGWIIKNQALVNGKTGEPMRFEILLVQPDFERVVLPFVQNLKRLGVDARVRTVDTSQYQNRIDSFDFDVSVGSFGQSLSPGNEQRDFWGSGGADRPGSRNIIGIKNAAVDKLISLIIAAPDRDALVARSRALDRVLLWGHYVIPQWHSQSFRIAYWKKFERPEITPKYGLCLACWWIDEKKAESLKKRMGR